CVLLRTAAARRHFFNRPHVSTYPPLAPFHSSTLKPLHPSTSSLFRLFCCHPDRSAAPFAARSGGTVARFPRHPGHRVTPLSHSYTLALLHFLSPLSLSSRPQCRALCGTQWRDRGTILTQPRPSCNSTLAPFHFCTLILFHSYTSSLPPPTLTPLPT